MNLELVNPRNSLAIASQLAIFIFEFTPIHVTEMIPFEATLYSTFTLNCNYCYVAFLKTTV